MLVVSFYSEAPSVSGGFNTPLAYECPFVSIKHKEKDLGEAERERRESVGEDDENLKKKTQNKTPVEEQE